MGVLKLSYACPQSLLCNSKISRMYHKELALRARPWALIKPGTLAPLWPTGTPEVPALFPAVWRDVGAS